MFRQLTSHQGNGQLPSIPTSGPSDKDLVPGEIIDGTKEGGNSPTQSALGGSPRTATLSRRGHRSPKVKSPQNSPPVSAQSRLSAYDNLYDPNPDESRGK